MTGGSFGHLYGIDDLASLLLNKSKLKDIADRIKYYPGPEAEEAYRKTVALLDSMEKFEASTMAAFDNLRVVFHAVEWVESLDWPEEEVQRVLSEWSAKTDTDA